MEQIASVGRELLASKKRFTYTRDQEGYIGLIVTLVGVAIVSLLITLFTACCRDCVYFPYAIQKKIDKHLGLDGHDEHAKVALSAADSNDTSASASGSAE